MNPEGIDIKVKEYTTKMNFVIRAFFYRKTVF